MKNYANYIHYKNGYLAFLKKEFTENIKNFRFLILFAVFLIFGAASPFLARYTPQILSALSSDMQMGAEPAALDAWQQFYKNISGIGFSAFIILFGSCLSGEYAKGTLVLLVTKGLPRSAIILAKFTAAAVLMTVSYWVSFAAAYGCTAYLWPGENLKNVVLAGFFLWMIGFFYLSILILGSVLFRQAFTGILFTGGAAAVISLAGLVRPLAGCSPFVLTTENVDLIAGTVTASEFAVPVVISVVIALLGVLSAVRIFDKKQL